MDETLQDKYRPSSEAISKLSTMSSSHAELKLLRHRTPRLIAPCNQMNPPCEQLRSKKDLHCAWSIRRDVGHDLRMQEIFPCKCNGELLARGQVHKSAGAFPFIAWQSLSVKA